MPSGNHAFDMDSLSAQSGLALQVGVYSTEPSASESFLASLTQLSEYSASLHSNRTASWSFHHIHLQ